MFTIIGLRRVDYTSKKTGNRVLGYNLYCTYEDKNTDGLACESIYLSDSKLDEESWEPSVGDVFYPVYNRFGRIERVDVQ